MNNLVMQIKDLNTEIKSLLITNDEQLENANKLTKKCNDLIKEVKASHKEEIAKYHSLHKKAKEQEKAELAPLEKGKDILKNAIGKYMREREEKLLEIKKQQEEEQALFGVALTESKEEVKLGGTHVRKVWKARVVDESKVPVKYSNIVIRTIDMSKLNEIAKFEEGQAKIPGVEFYQEEVVVIR